MKKITLKLFLGFMFLVSGISYAQLTQDFEGAWPPAGWTIESTSTIETWAPLEDGINGISANVEYDFDQNETLISPVFTVPATLPQLRFSISMSYYWAIDPNDNYDVLISISTDGGTTWAQIWDETQLGEFISWDAYHVVVPLAAYAGQTNAKIKFNYVGSDGAQLIIDDVIVSTCGMPGLLNASNITTTGATLSWASVASNFDVEYGVSGFVQGTGTLLTDVTNNLAVTLDDSTDYCYYVRAKCDTTSNWVGPYCFTTPCAAANLPYILNFESGMPVCTSVVNEGLGNEWFTDNGEEYGFSGTKLKYEYSEDFAADTWFYTNGLNLTAGTTYRITYDYGGTGGYPESLKVAYGSSATPAAMTNVIADYPAILNDTPLTEIQLFTPAASGVYFFGFHAYSEADLYLLFVDNIEIQVNPVCSNVISLAASDITESSANITWAVVPGAAGYEYVFDQQAADPAGAGTPTTETAYTASFTGTPGAPGVVYYLHVRTNCGTTFSDWRTVSFTSVPIPPLNDECEGAIELIPAGTFAGGEIIASNIFASSDDLAEPTCQANVDQNVWFKVVVPESGSLTIETAANPGSEFYDSVMVVYTGDCAAMTPVECDDDDSTDAFSVISLTGRPAGETLYVSVWMYTFFGFGTEGSFKIAAYDASLATNPFESKNGLKAYPNPVKDMLNLSYAKEISNVSVYNLLGQEVISKVVGTDRSQVDMSNLASGSYLVKVTADNQVKTIKVIKE